MESHSKQKETQTIQSVIITANAFVKTDDPVKCYTTEVGTQTEYQENAFVHHQSSVQQSMNSISTKTSGKIPDKTNSEGTTVHKMNEMMDVKNTS